MDVIEEYINQQSWRNWNQYVNKIPLSPNDHIIDLGCSVGGVANLLSEKVNRVTGIDLNPDVINYCEARKKPNQHFICSDFENVNYDSLKPITGVWASFSVSYLNNPEDFLKQMFHVIQPNGWIALVDVACFLSGNMTPGSQHYELVKRFESESYKTGNYDFNFGSKMEPLLAAAGFVVFHADKDVPDDELNFDGAANSVVLANWKARLNRIQGLRNRYPDVYPAICADIIASLESEHHAKNNNLRFVVARKS